MQQTTEVARNILSLRQDSSALAVPESQWRNLLNTAQPDSLARIRRIEISGTPESRIHVASIPQQVGCHFHRVGGELYSVVAGRGTIHFGLVEERADGPVVRVWYQLDVRAGDTFTIPQGYAHQLEKAGGQELVILFECPDSHLNEDRIFLPDSPNLQATKSL
jgi:mannose-6-phosphate isomerase-like protein (cupin superfamily)